MVKRAKNRQVSFSAKKIVQIPTIVEFDTKKGKVSFTAKTSVKKPLRVKFTVKKK